VIKIKSDVVMDHVDLLIHFAQKSTILVHLKDHIDVKLVLAQVMLITVQQLMDVIINIHKNVH